ncbi:MAG: hypothetical protein IKG23_01115 [Clostridia bacterium]|nr:hypothetical protein [Clostridia bacterium]
MVPATPVAGTTFEEIDEAGFPETVSPDICFLETSFPEIAKKIEKW